MGNQLNLQTLKQSLYEYQPNLLSYDVIKVTGKAGVNQSITWQHRSRPQRLVQKKYFLRTYIQYDQLLSMFAFRYNDQFVMATKFLIVENHLLKQVQSQGIFPETWVRVFYEQSITNLSYFKQVPQQDAAYFLLQTLNGLEKLKNMLKFPFEFRQQMLHINQRRQAKVWLCQQISLYKVADSLRALLSQSQMVIQILSVIKQNIYFTTPRRQFKKNEQSNLMDPNIIEQIIRKAPKTIKQAIKLVQNSLRKTNVQTGEQMTCLKQFSHDELIDIMQTTKAKVKQKSPPTKEFYNNNQGANAYCKAPVQPFVQQNRNIFIACNQKQNLNSRINMQKSYSAKNLNGTQKVQQRGQSTKDSRSRSHNNKKCGISLVKNGYSNSNQKTHNYPGFQKSNKNHQSLLVIKPVNNLSLNQRPQITLNNAPVHLPPRCAKNVIFYDSNNQKQNFMVIQDSEISKQSLRKRSNFGSNTHQTKGINITRTDVIKAQQSRANNHCNKAAFFQSCINNSNSPIYAGNFPLPVSNNSNNTRGVNVNVTKDQSSKNFRNFSPFDPVLPNQSLTRLHKEATNLNNSPKSSAQSFYQVPKIYVHTPETPHTIKRNDSTIESQNRQSKQNFHQAIITQNQAKYDRVKQDQEISRLQKQKQKSYERSIYDNQKVFTDPKLYEYITNNSSYHIRTSVNKKNEVKQREYFDYLANVQISQSLDYNAVKKGLQNMNDKFYHPNQQKSVNIEQKSPHHFSINDFPTIQQIQQNPNDQAYERNVSFIPIALNLNLASNTITDNSQNPVTTKRRGNDQSVVVQYQKFYDDTNRSINSQNKQCFAPLKRNSNLANNQIQNSIVVGNNWQISQAKPSMPQQNNVKFKLPVGYQGDYVSPIGQSRRIQLLPAQKNIYIGQKPAINPLLLQDMQKLRLDRTH